MDVYLVEEGLAGFSSHRNGSVKIEKFPCANCFWLFPASIKQLLSSPYNCTIFFGPALRSDVYIAAAFPNAFLVLSMQSPALSCEWLVRPQEKDGYGEEPEGVGPISRPARGPRPRQTTTDERSNGRSLWHCTPADIFCTDGRPHIGWGALYGELEWLSGFPMLVHGGGLCALRPRCESFFPDLVDSQLAIPQTSRRGRSRVLSVGENALFPILIIFERFRPSSVRQGILQISRVSPGAAVRAGGLGLGLGLTQILRDFNHTSSISSKAESALVWAQ